MNVNKQANHAPPIAPLKERDWKELILLFDRQDSDAIEADVVNKLKMLYPEPSWDEELFFEQEIYEFLEEYL
ncbi:hypothetical protein [Calothrix sp. UHCC 0171]|uniref:hypothetical protein n=1 Tax=Calothrix sp. UHCC 0171 TaxID=3110245 RepID=UPI002B1FDEBF|nr:hypothetical protein [Calothrix sp. UHCC 0171]MEA5572342.1 hypothetical protein [Calothrix sp. UHCC 0171]